MLPFQISLYLIQYGRIKKIGTNGAVQIDKRDLIKYYESYVVSGRKLINTRKIKEDEQVEKELNVCGSSGRL